MKKLSSFLVIVMCIFALLSFASCELLGLARDLGNLANSFGGEEGDFEYDEEYVESHLPEQYYISYTMKSTEDGQTDTGTITLIKCSQGYYFSNSAEGEADLYYKLQDKYFHFTRESTLDPWEEDFNYVLTEEDVKNLSEAYTGFLTYYSGTGYTSVLKESGTGTVAGHSCKKYTYSFSSFGVSVNVEAYVEDSTGICLKFNTGGKSYDGSAKASIECTKYETDSTKIQFPGQGLAQQIQSYLAEIYSEFAGTYTEATYNMETQESEVIVGGHTITITADGVAKYDGAVIPMNLMSGSISLTINGELYMIAPVDEENGVYAVVGGSLVEPWYFVKTKD